MLLLLHLLLPKWMVLCSTCERHWPPIHVLGCYWLAPCLCPYNRGSWENEPPVSLASIDRRGCCLLTRFHFGRKTIQEWFEFFFKKIKSSHSHKQHPSLHSPKNVNLETLSDPVVKYNSLGMNYFSVTLGNLLNLYPQVKCWARAWLSRHITYYFII